MNFTKYDYHLLKIKIKDHKSIGITCYFLINLSNTFSIKVNYLCTLLYFQGPDTIVF